MEGSLRLIKNSGSDRVIDLLTEALPVAHSMDFITTEMSLYAFLSLKNLLMECSPIRFIAPVKSNWGHFLGGPGDRPYRNQLLNFFLAKQQAGWLENQVEIRYSDYQIPQSIAVLYDGFRRPFFGVCGSFSFSTNGLGINLGNPLGLIQVTETPEEASRLSSWFEQQWHNLPQTKTSDSPLIRTLWEISEDRSPNTIYALVLYSLFKDRDESLDEDSIIKSATGIHQTTVWKKLYKFQRDAVVGAIDKL
ncbi:MAG: helicase, partial [Methanobacteriota archaeon]